MIVPDRYTYSRVEVYTIDGWSRELPELNTGRRNHGCGQYVNTDNKMVNCATGSSYYQYKSVNIFRFFL